MKALSYDGEKSVLAIKVSQGSFVKRGGEGMAPEPRPRLDDLQRWFVCWHVVLAAVLLVKISQAGNVAVKEVLNLSSKQAGMSEEK
jgi:hypothetical protein